MSHSYEVADVLARRPRAGSRTASDVSVDPHQLGSYQPFVEDSEISDHRQVFVGVHIPLKGRGESRIERTPRSRGRGHHHKRKKRKNGRGGNTTETDSTPAIDNPTAKVRFILGGQEADQDDQTHDVFTELEEFYCDENGVEEWKETARWLKFEEDVEEGGDRWSKPHVATLSLYSVFELRSCIVNGTVLLDMHANNLIQITDLILDDLVFRKYLEQDNRAQVREALLKKHKHQNERARKKTKPKPFGTPSTRKTSVPSFLGGNKLSTPSYSIPGSKSVPHHLADVDKNVAEVEEGQRAFPELPSAVSLVTQGASMENPILQSEGSDPSFEKYDSNFMKKIPPGAEASNVLVGEVDFLKKPITAFVRLEDSMLLGDLTEVPIPTRFLFIMLGPPSSPGRYHEVGRAIATLMTDEVFGEVAYKAKCREDLLAGVDEFLMQTTVLPPCEWDPNIRIEPPAAVASQMNRLTAPRQLSCPGKNGGDEEHDPAGDRDEQLKKTGRLCGGLIADIKRRWPWYKSDFKDALSSQVIASVIFIYFACLTKMFTFGGLMGEKTHKYMGTMEQMLASCTGGILFALFSGQPLIILGATGPMLVFEEIVFKFCQTTQLDYMPFRLWIGIWTMCYCIILVITDTSALVHYFTRFTEESFATLIALIYIYEGFKKLMEVSKKHPFNTGYINHHYCLCKTQMPYTKAHMYPNGTWNNQTLYNNTILDVPYMECSNQGGVLEGDACSDNVFFLSVLLCLGTFTIAISLKGFKTSSYFPTKVRAVIADFAVIISIIIMVLFDYFVGVNTPKLQIPRTFRPTANEKTEVRSWIIPPLGKNPWWIILAASIPAILVTILVFMDQQITALIVNRREHKLKKGAGYHLDLLLVAIIIGICSILGLPWIVAATVLSVSHTQSLFLESQCRAPGEKPKFLGVRENRVTGTVIFLLIGLSVFMAPLLKVIPMPVLYGLFLYMGVTGLRGLQLFERIKVVFMPIKHQPDLAYLRQVPLRRIHLFTAVQFLCLVVLWVIKSTAASLIFPVMVLMLVAVRKLMEHIFTKHELEVLDDLMPETIKKKKIDEEELRKEEARSMQELDKEIDEIDGEAKSHLNGDVPDGTNEKKPVQEIPINITHEMCKTSLWKSMVKDDQKSSEKKPRSKHRHHHHRHHKKKSRKAEDEGLWFRMDSRKDVGTIVEVEEPQTPKLPLDGDDPNLISDQIPAIQVALSRSELAINESESGSDSEAEAQSKPLLKRSSEHIARENGDVVVDIPTDVPEAEVSLLNGSIDEHDSSVVS